MIRNLSDSGLPDRIAWIKAAAQDRPLMDLERVGIYGGSAGGQSTLAALLHHGDFYKEIRLRGCLKNRGIGFQPVSDGGHLACRDGLFTAHPG